MRTWTVLYRKEMLELVRQYKVIWVPIVFILLGATQPVVSYFLPDILAGAGSLPEGAVIDIPLPKPAEVLAETFGQYNTLGALIIALSFMGTISGERSSGTAAMILVKPVSYASFVTAKWAAMLTLTGLSFALGFLASWAYTEALIGSVDAGGAVAGMLVYLLWIAFIGTLTVAASALLRGAAPAAFAALAAAALLSILSGMFPAALKWSPGSLSGHANALLQNGGAPGMNVWAGAGCTVAAAVLLLGAAVRAVRLRPSLEK